jgi:hypothetical protein
MDLNFVAGKSASLLKSLEEFGCDLDSLLYVTKDFFALCDDLDMNPRQTAEVFIKLKNSFDRSMGKGKSQDLIVYENSRINPTRLCLENRNSGCSIFFSAIPGQKQVERSEVFYSCEQCEKSTNIKRTEVQSHYISTHI